jgi:hypothetical protein
MDTDAVRVDLRSRRMESTSFKFSRLQTRCPIKTRRRSLKISPPFLSHGQVRQNARNFGKLPAWHAGAGGDAWIFADEILIEGLQV